MPMPTYEDAMLPVMQALSNGEPQHRRVLAAAMADYFKLTSEEREKLHSER